MFNIARSLTRLRVLWAAILIMITAGACVPARLGVTWAGLRTIGDDQRILVAYNDRLSMVDPTNGSVVELRKEDGSRATDAEGKTLTWDLKGDQNATSQFYSSPVTLDEKTLLVASYDNRLFKVEQSTGRVQRVTPIEVPANAGHVLSDLAFDDTTVYMGFSDRDVVAIDTLELTPRWTFNTQHGVWAKPLVVDGVVYFGSMDHYLYAVDADTGEERWKLDLGGAITSSPVHQDGHLYIGNLARKIFDISTSGEKLAEYETQDWVWGTPALFDGVLYAADLSGHVYALDTGEQLRQIWKTPAAQMGIRATPLVTENFVIVASRDGWVHWLSRSSGSIILIDNQPGVEIGAEILSDLLLIQPNEKLNIPEPLVVVSTVSHDRILVALTLDGGRRRWVYAR